MFYEVSPEPAPVAYGSELTKATLYFDVTFRTAGCLYHWPIHEVAYKVTQNKVQGQCTHVHVSHELTHIWTRHCVK